MSDIEIFNNPLANSDLFKSLQGVNTNLLSGSGSGEERRRISLNGSKFREIINGEQMNVSKEDFMNVIILNAAPVSRTYYASAFDPSNPLPPTCWSSDSKVPAPEVAEEDRQATRCLDCKQNVRGSGQGDGRACKFGQRIAVVLEGQLDKVYQLNLSALSIFGEGKGNDRPLQSYVKYLSSHKTPAISVVTKMYFDENASVPKLFFKPVRPLTEEELNTVAPMMNSPEVLRAIELVVNKGEEETPKAIAFEEPEKSEEKVEEPKKVVKKQAAPPKEKDEELDSIIEDWDD